MCARGCVPKNIKKRMFKVDNVKYVSVILYFIQIIDMYSDGIFCFQLNGYYDEAKNGEPKIVGNIDKETRDIFYWLWIFALTFTVMPYLFNFISSVRIISAIAVDDSISEFTKA